MSSETDKDMDDATILSKKIDVALCYCQAIVKKLIPAMLDSPSEKMDDHNISTPLPPSPPCNDIQCSNESQLSYDEAAKTIKKDPFIAEDQAGKETFSPLSMVDDSIISSLQEQRNMELTCPQSTKVENEDFADLWREYFFSMCSWDSSSEAENKHLLSGHCEHNYVFKMALGLVCSLCGRVGQSVAKYELTNIRFYMKHKSKKQKRLEKEQNDGPEISKLIPLRGMQDTSGAELLKLHPQFAKTMHPHQVDGFKFLCKNLLLEGNKQPGGCILAHAPGTGKTFLVISFLQSFLNEHPEPEYRPLIIAPKIMLKPWKKEFEKWAIEKIVTYNLNEDGRGQLQNEESITATEALKFSRLKTLQDWGKTRGVLLLSYNLFASLASNGLSANSTPIEKEICALLLGAGLLILDEAHYARNEKTKILETLTEFQTTRRILLTGTLFQNNFRELFNILKLCRPNFMGHCFDHNTGPKEFERPGGEEAAQAARQERVQEERQMFMDEIGNKFSDIPSGLSASEKDAHRRGIQIAVDKLRSLTSSFIHWHAGEILNTLPGRVEFSVLLDLTVEQRKAHAKLVALMARGNALDYDLKLAALCIHPSLLQCAKREDENAVQDATLEGPKVGIKTLFIFDLIQYCQHSGDKEKILIFSQQLTPFDLLESMFTQDLEWTKGIDFLRLDGSMNDDERQRVIDAFNSEDSSYVLLASLKACGEGICLTGASRVIMLDVAWNPAAIHQAVSRAFRIGQRRVVYVYRLIAFDTEELLKYKTTMWKEGMSRFLLDKETDIDKIMDYINWAAYPMTDDSDTGDRFMDMLIDKRNKHIAGVYKHVTYY